MKFAFYTLGCKVNQYETQAMEQLLTQKGHTVGSFSEKSIKFTLPKYLVALLRQHLF